MAALNDFFESCPAIISPTNAPANGPIITPQGPIQKAARNPSVQPHTPYLVPPNFFVPHIGIIKSSTREITTTPAKIKMVFVSNGFGSLNCCISNPIKATGGPGKSGSKLPSIATMHKTIPSIIQNHSIVV